MENLYSIKINKTGRYVKYCDDCWYETDSAELRLFTKAQAENIARQMRKHYVYSVTVSNGTDIIDTGSQKKKEKATTGLKNFKLVIKGKK